VPELNRDHFIPNPRQLIIHKLFYHSTLRSPERQRRKISHHIAFVLEEKFITVAITNGTFNAKVHTCRKRRKDEHQRREQEQQNHQAKFN
jgi:hypothetical protein